MSSTSSFRHRLIIVSITALGVLLACIYAAQINAQSTSGRDVVDGGALMLRGKGLAEALPAIRLGTDMDVKVTGQVARVTVTQAFRNSTDKWMEATYLYPMPEDGAVDSLKMVVGQKIFIGHIKRKEEAREIYETALAEGRKAGLVEEARDNLFRNSVANVGPYETVLIQIEYQAPVRQEAGEFSIRLPLVAGMRYIPPHTLTDGAALVDAANVTAPTLRPDLAEGMNPVSIKVTLAPGFEPANVISPYHKVVVATPSKARRVVQLAQGQVPANRDFELRWRSASADPTVGLFREKHGNEHFVMASIMPPVLDEVGPIPPREMIFVIDNSGSMSGASIRQARESLLYALDTLRPQDRFNIIRFDDTMTVLFDDEVAANAENLATARAYTRGIDAEGGTEMLPALKAALRDDAPTSHRTVRQVIFLTDGNLSNEREMMAEIAANRGRSRVFMVGIGSAPNNFLMSRMAEAGRGTFTNVGFDGEVVTRMKALLNKLQAPAVTELAVSVEGGSLSFTPKDLPDLYAGEPLVLLGKGKSVSGKLVVTGNIGGKAWKSTIDLSQAIESDVVAKLWAHRSIADIEAQRYSNEIDYLEADEKIAELGLAYGLVTSQTSLVAEDETPTRPEGAQLTREELPLLLPEGWDFDHLFGQKMNAGYESADASSAEDDEGLDLMQGGIGFANDLNNGLILLVIGLGGLALLRRKRKAA